MAARPSIMAWRRTVIAGVITASGGGGGGGGAGNQKSAECRTWIEMGKRRSSMAKRLTKLGSASSWSYGSARRSTEFRAIASVSAVQVESRKTDMSLPSSVSGASRSMRRNGDSSCTVEEMSQPCSGIPVIPMSTEMRREMGPAPARRLQG